MIYGKQSLGAQAGPGDQQGQITHCLLLEQSYTHTQCVCAQCPAKHATEKLESLYVVLSSVNWLENEKNTRFVLNQLLKDSHRVMQKGK